jgi:hypothetical protein
VGTFTGIVILKKLRVEKLSAYTGPGVGYFLYGQFSKDHFLYSQNLYDHFLYDCFLYGKKNYAVTFNTVKIYMVRNLYG